MPFHKRWPMCSSTSCLPIHFQTSSAPRRSTVIRSEICLGMCRSIATYINTWRQIFAALATSTLLCNGQARSVLVANQSTRTLLTTRITVGCSRVLGEARRQCCGNAVMSYVPEGTGGSIPSPCKARFARGTPVACTLMLTVYNRATIPGR